MSCLCFAGDRALGSEYIPHVLVWVFLGKASKRIAGAEAKTIRPCS